MAKGQYIGVNNVARKITKQYIGIGNVARKITKGYIGVGNVAREYFTAETPVSELEIGSSVFMTNTDGNLIEFIVVHHGNPNAGIYDVSCDGTWLLTKLLYNLALWRSSTHMEKGYHASQIHMGLNGSNNSTIGAFADYAEIIKEVKIPYNKIYDGGISYYTRENGVSAKLFALSRSEVGGDSDRIGSCLEYFSDPATVKSRRKVVESKYDEDEWWLREMDAAGNAYLVDTFGNIDDVPSTDSKGVRFALILPSEALVDDKFNVIT